MSKDFQNILAKKGIYQNDAQKYLFFNDSTAYDTSKAATMHS